MIKRITGRDGHISYICRLCERTCNSKKVTDQRSTENLINQHLQSNQHLSKMKMQEEIYIGSEVLEWPEDNFNRSSSSQEGQRTSLPGHSSMLPPASSSFISSLLKDIELKKQPPFLGLEYIIEFIDAVRCYLCDCLKTEKTPIAHLSSKNHKEKYMRAHFPETLDLINVWEKRAEQTNLSFLSSKVLKYRLLKEVETAVHSHCGVLLPTFNESLSLNANHELIKQFIASGTHCNEENFPQIKEIINEANVKKMLIADIEQIFPGDHSSPVSKETFMEVSSTECAGKGSNSEDSDEPNTEGSAPMSIEETEEADSTKNLSFNDYQVLLENFESLIATEQQRLTKQIKAVHEANTIDFQSLREILSDKAKRFLDEALM